MSQKTNKNRKYDRNRKWCDMYRKLGRREKNKRIKLMRHIRRFPDDLQAARALKTL